MASEIPAEIACCKIAGRVVYATRCDACDGHGRGPDSLMRAMFGCNECDGVGYIGVNPYMPTLALPGSPAKVAVLAQRYRSGEPLWLDGDAVHEDQTPHQLSVVDHEDDDFDDED